MAKFTFKDAKLKIAELEAELASVKNDLTDGDGKVSKNTHIITSVIVAIASFLVGTFF